MPTTFILIDFENVQPKDFSLLQGGQAQVKVFLGPHQSRIPVALAASLQPLGPNVEYVVLETPGKNALDFQVAYHLGHLSAANPAASFQIISKDAGFDPLIEHLRGKGIRIRRSTSVDVQKQSSTTKPAGHLERAIDYLKRRKASMPATTKTLLSTLRAHFREELSEEQLAALMTSLQKRKVVQLAGNKVTYRFPADANT